MASTPLQIISISPSNGELETPPSITPTRRTIPRWMILVAAFGVIFIAVGVPNSYGVFQEHYSRVLFPTRPDSELILIGSLASSLYMILGAFTGRIADLFGHWTALAIGSCFIVGSLFAASAATSFTALLLTQGLAFGIGTAFVYYPAVTVSQRLFQRRGLANGFVISGGALGGCVLPYSTRVLLQRVGLQGTFRVLGGLAGGILLLAAVVFAAAPASANPRAQRRQPTLVVVKELLHDPRFLIILAASTVAMTGFLPRYFLITPSAIQKGIGADYAAWLLGIMNGLSILGRLAIGSFADRYGKLKALVASFTLCGIAHLLFWLPAVSVNGEQTTALMTVFVVFVGLLGSGFVSLIPVVVADIFGSEDLASKVGFLNSILGIGVLAGPSAVYAIVNNGDYTWAVLFSGLLMLVGGIMLTGTYGYL